MRENIGLKFKSKMNKKKRKKKEQNNLARTFVRWTRTCPPTTQTYIEFGDFAELYMSSLVFNKSLLNLEAAA